MGFFGGLIARAERVLTKVKETVSTCKDNFKSYVKEKKENLKNNITNMWNKFSGKDKFLEAEKIYAEISERYNRRRKEFQKSVVVYTEKIEKHVDTINKSKEKIKYELFVEMAKKMKQIKDIEISKDFSVEAYLSEVIEFDSIRSKSQLYKIDFNKHKFKTSVQAVFTLGFYTRKKAKETLFAVQEEEMKLNAEIAKMDAELVKLKAIESSLENVALYFTSLIELYENLLLRLDSSINYLFVRCMSFAHKLVHAEMSIKRLPKMNQKEVEAIITASKILKAMTDAQITSVEDKAKVERYNRELAEKYEALNKVYDAA